MDALRNVPVAIRLLCPIIATGTSSSGKSRGCTERKTSSHPRGRIVIDSKTIVGLSVSLDLRHLCANKQSLIALFPSPGRVFLSGKYALIRLNDQVLMFSLYRLMSAIVWRCGVEHHSNVPPRAAALTLSCRVEFADQCCSISHFCARRLSNDVCSVSVRLVYCSSETRR